MFKLILSLLLGMTIGANIIAKLYKDAEETQSSIIKTYDDYVRFLEEEFINFYKEALKETLNQNIELRKKLKTYD